MVFSSLGRRLVLPSVFLVSVPLMACEDSQDTILQPDTQVVQSAAKDRGTRDPLLLLHQGLTLDERWRALDLVAGGFAGFHIDEEGNPVISVTRMEAEPTATAALQSSRNAAALRTPRVSLVEFSFSTLDDWRNQFMGLEDPDAVFFDVDEVSNRVTVGVTSEDATERIAAAARGFGIPERGLNIRYIGPGPHDRQSLHWHGGYGGTQFNALDEDDEVQGPCTLGVSGIWQNKDVFVSAAHCSLEKFASDSARVRQRWNGGNATIVADEVYDPTYAQVSLSCDIVKPNGEQQTKPCRRSDAALYEWRNGANFEHYSVIETTYGRPDPPLHSGYGFGSIQFDTLESGDAKHWVITDAMDDYSELYAGTLIQKVGRTTGWTLGMVLNCAHGKDPVGQTTNCEAEERISTTCFNYYYSGANTTALECQFEAYLYSDAGDSGAPILFQAESLYPLFDDPTPTKKLAGILWGGPTASDDEEPDTGGPNDGGWDENEYYTWFSPWPGVLFDLGSVSVCHPAGPGC